MNYVFGIVTYHRNDRQKMLEYLHGLGYGKSDIIIQTQDQNDYNALEPLYKDQATILYKSGSNISENKNNLMDWVCEHMPGKRLVICSDKVRGIKYLKDKHLASIQSKQALDTLIARAFKKCDFYMADLWGTYTTENAFFMSHTTSINAQLLGCFMGVCDPRKWRFDKEQPLKEDFELVLRIISRGGSVLRFNDLALNATFHTKGGCHELWNAKGDAVNKQCNDRLLARYPSLIVPHATRANEQKYIGPTIKLKESIIIGK